MKSRIDSKSSSISEMETEPVGNPGNITKTSHEKFCPYKKNILDYSSKVITWVSYSPKRQAAINFLMGKKLYNNPSERYDDITDFEKVAILALHPLNDELRNKAIKEWKMSKEMIIDVVVLHSIIYINSIAETDMQYAYILTGNLCGPLNLSLEDFSNGMKNNYEKVYNQMIESEGWYN